MLYQWCLIILTFSFQECLLYSGYSPIFISVSFPFYVSYLSTLANVTFSILQSNHRERTAVILGYFSSYRHCRPVQRLYMLTSRRRAEPSWTIVATTRDALPYRTFGSEYKINQQDPLYIFCFVFVRIHCFLRFLFLLFPSEFSYCVNAMLCNYIKNF